MVDHKGLFTHYFDFNIRYLKFCALWFYQSSDLVTSSQTKHLQHFYNLFWLIYSNVCYLPFEILYIFFGGDLDIFLRGLRDIGNHVSLVFKAMNYLRKRQEILKILEILQCSNKYEYEDFGSFRQKLIVEREKKQAKMWTFYFFVFCNLICLTMFVSGLFVFLFNSEGEFIENFGVRVYNQKQPINTISPFGSGTRSKFIVTFIYTILAGMVYAWMIVGKKNCYRIT